MYRKNKGVTPLRIELVNVPCTELSKLYLLFGMATFAAWRCFKSYDRRLKKLDARIKALEPCSECEKEETEMLDKDILEDEFLK